MEIILAGYSAGFESQHGRTAFEIGDWFTAADVMIGSMFIWKGMWNRPPDRVPNSQPMWTGSWRVENDEDWETLLCSELNRKVVTRDLRGLCTERH